MRKDVLDAAKVLWRPLPWRGTRDPWHVLVSEVMLQQTQASRVVGPYLRFVRRFPSPAACAAASRGDVVRAWAGLGYNRRAVRLHEAAARIVAVHEGAVPGTLADLEALPGVGPYTARAVLAFAFDEAVGVVDVNVARVLSRAVAGAPLRPREAQGVADGLAPGPTAWRFNQALFDLGAQVCTARRPACGSCPLRRRCRWKAAGRPLPDPGAAGARQGRFEGSARQGRGRLVSALRTRPVPEEALADAAGWPGEHERARAAADSLVRDGLARWKGDVLALE